MSFPAKMDYSEFCCKLIELGVNIDTEYGQKTKWEYQADHSHPREKVVKKGRDTIVQKTVIGEATNGNCWNDDPAVYHSVDIKDGFEFKDLDILISELCPNISYLQFKNLWNELVQEKEEVETEYYGNYTKYHVFSVDVEDLYNYLQGIERSE